jgi:hypothetical protein
MDVVHPSLISVAAFKGVGDVETFVDLRPPDIGSGGFGDEVSGLVGRGVADGPDVFTRDGEAAAVADLEDQEISFAEIFGVDERWLLGFELGGSQGCVDVFHRCSNAGTEHFLTSRV